MTVPTEYLTDAKLESAYRRGWNRGHGIACHNVPAIGETILSDSMGRVTVTSDNICEVHTDICFAVEMAGRDFSPFEFIAHEFNEDEDSAEELWEAFEAGISDAIHADVADYSEQDYGIAR